MDHEKRIGELEDEVKQLKKRVEEVRQERDEERELVTEMREQVEDSNALIDSWIESFDMAPNDKGEWGWDMPRLNEILDTQAEEYLALLKNWNKFTAEYNAVVAARRRNFGRPLAASPSQQADVLKRRKDGQSLRAIAEDTGLGLRTVRTIIDKADGVDRATAARLQRIAPDKLAAARAKAGRRIRAALPARINEVRKRGDKLLKKAKGR